MYVYEVAPWAYRTLNDRIAVAIEESIGLDIEDDWTRELGKVDLAKVLGAALSKTNPVFSQLTDGTDTYGAAKTGQLPSTLDTGALRVKEQSPLTSIQVSNFPADYPDSAVATKLAAGLPALLDTGALKVREQSPITTIDVTDEASRLLGEVDNLKKWGGTALTCRDISLDFAKLTDIETNTDGLLKTADLSLEAITKHLAVDVQNYPATYPDTDVEPRNISKIGGTAQTGADWTPLLQKLDVALSTLGRLQPWYQPNFTRSNPSYFGAGIAPHAVTTRWTYTVPANRIAKLMSGFAMQERYQAATTPGVSEAILYGPQNVPIIYLVENTAVVGVEHYNLIPESAIAIAGDTFIARTSDASTGGSYLYWIGANIMEFDV
jgi:hypothetical protein